MAGKVAMVEIDVDAPRERVWAALTEPDLIADYMMGSRVQTDWQRGSPITWAGEWEGKPYEDKGEVVAVDEPNRIEVTHWSPLTGTDDAPENYHTLVYTLDDAAGGTEVTLTQDNNGDDKEVRHNTDNWSQMLGQLKRHVEAG